MARKSSTTSCSVRYCVYGLLSLSILWMFCNIFITKNIQVSYDVHSPPSVSMVHSSPITSIPEHSASSSSSDDDVEEKLSEFDHFHLHLVPETTQVIMGVSEGAKKDPRGYGVQGILKFVKSAFDNEFDGYIVIATDAFEEVAPKVVEFIQDSYSTEKKLILVNVEKYRIGFLESLHPKELRYYLYQHWATMFTSDDTMMLISDVRDTVFQANPFDPIYWKEVEGEDYELFLFYESDRVTLRTSEYNSKWIKSCFGPSILEDIGDNLVICSGTSAGTARAMEKYAKAMVNEMASSEWVHCRKELHDQIFHNYLKANDSFDSKVFVFGQGSGPANNIGNTPTYPFTDENYTVLNIDGTPSALVHQYDRHPSIRDRVRKYIRNKFKEY